ncbi:hypothetical protein [uncultured Sphaerochaeta sp.]
MENKDSWDNEQLSCPGMGKGKRYGKDEIEKLLAVEPGNEPITIL